MIMEAIFSNGSGALPKQVIGNNVPIWTVNENNIQWVLFIRSKVPVHGFAPKYLIQQKYIS